MDTDTYGRPGLNSADICKLFKGILNIIIKMEHIEDKYGVFGTNYKTKFDETSSVAEENFFLKDYTIPFVQLESKKTILIFSHNVKVVFLSVIMKCWDSAR